MVAIILVFIGRMLSMLVTKMQPKRQRGRKEPAQPPYRLHNFADSTRLGPTNQNFGKVYSAPLVFSFGAC